MAAVTAAITALAVASATVCASAREGRPLAQQQSPCSSPKKSCWPAAGVAARQFIGQLQSEAPVSASVGSATPGAGGNGCGSRGQRHGATAGKRATTVPLTVASAAAAAATTAPRAGASGDFRSAMQRVELSQWWSLGNSKSG
eukprot:108517-Chlamydomonas_euryale.AAC.2